MLFEEASKYFEKLEEISSRLEMIDLLEQMIKNVGKDEIRALVYFTEGVVAPAFDGIEMGIAEKLAEEAIANATGYEKGVVAADFKKSGDLGSTAESMTSKSKLVRMVHNKFTINEVFAVFRKIARTNGSGSKDTKVKLMSELIAASSGIEARYVVRFALGQLRLGAGDATLMEALSKAKTGSRDAKADIENAYNLCSDLGHVAEVLFDGGIDAVKRFKVSIFKPIRPALAERMPTAQEIIAKMNGECSLESKYDGIRVQVHMDKKSKRVEIFSRRQERITEMFPDIVDAALHEISANEVIFDGEAIAYDDNTGEYHHFQETMQRKRKHGIEEKSVELPLHVFIFDVMYIDGKDMINETYEKRRQTLENMLPKEGMLRPTGRIITMDPKAFDKYFDEVVGAGLEGVIAKDIRAPYVAGARKFSWIKMKRSYKGELSDTLDLVVIGYYLGKGSRTSFNFGGLLCATYNNETDMFESVSRLGTGFSEAQMQKLEKALRAIKTKGKPARVLANIEPDFWVEPKYVVTIRADEITRSPMHTCGSTDGKDGTGYALRFPRLVSDGIRDDKGPDDATTTHEVISMFKDQKRIALHGE